MYKKDVRCFVIIDAPLSERDNPKLLKFFESLTDSAERNMDGVPINIRLFDLVELFPIVKCEQIEKLFSAFHWCDIVVTYAIRSPEINKVIDFLCNKMFQVKRIDYIDNDSFRHMLTKYIEANNF